MRVGVGLALFSVALASRLPFLTEQLYEHDSVLYARAVESFDPTAQRPHPPGYLWYVLLVRAGTLVLGDPNTAMTGISAVAGAAAVVLLYALGARMYDERTGRIAALFLLTSVAFWARGVVAYPYTLLAALTILVALLFWRAADRTEAGAARPERERRLIVAGAVWGLAAGFRPDLAVLLAPLWLLAAVMSAPRVRSAALSAAAAAAGVLLFLATSGAATPGGLSAYLAVLTTQTDYVGQHLRLENGAGAEIPRNAHAVGRFLGRALYAVAPLFLVFALSRDLRLVESREPRRTLFLLVWALTPLPLYVLVHVGEYGHVFTMLPGLLILAARAAIGAVRAARMPRALPQVVGAAVLANAAIFLLSDSPLSARDLARRDTGILEKAAWIRANADPGETLIVTAHDKVIIEHYLGTDYPLLEHEPRAPDLEPDSVCADLLRCQRRVILWDDLFVDGAAWEIVAMPGGAQLRVADVTDEAVVRIRGRRPPRR